VALFVWDVRGVTPPVVVPHEDLFDLPDQRAPVRHTC
jgi:hypothetical protein